MKIDNPILQKSYAFALKIVLLQPLLKTLKVDRIIATQLLKSGTSIGANVEEAIGGSSKKDFIQKMKIAYREARETHYWLRLMKDARLLTTDTSDVLLLDCVELLKLLTSILNKMQART